MWIVLVILGKNPVSLCSLQSEGDDDDTVHSDTGGDTHGLGKLFCANHGEEHLPG